MTPITVRLFHHPSRTPIAELQGVDPGATLSSLRAKAEQHLAAEEACMMRVFLLWHVEAVFGGRKRLIELTDEDSGSSLSSLGIEDCSAVLLEGPLTHTVEGVGQGLALVNQQLGAQMRRLGEENSRIEKLLLRIAEGMSTLVAGQRIMMELQLVKEHIISFPTIEHTARLVLATEERRAFTLLSMHKFNEADCLAVAAEEAKARRELMSTAHLEYQTLPLAIDTSTPMPNVKLESPHTAVKTEKNGAVTLRASQPLSAVNHRWAVRVHEIGSIIGIRLGLLPKLSTEIEAKMGGSRIHDLGGCCIFQHDINSFVHGDWQCDTLPFAKGSLVLFDYSFADKTLTIRCGDNEVVGRIPKAGDVLYPAFSFFYVGAKVSFEEYK